MTASSLGTRVYDSRCEMTSAAGGRSRGQGAEAPCPADSDRYGVTVNAIAMPRSTWNGDSSSVICCRLLKLRVKKISPPE